MMDDEKKVKHQRPQLGSWHTITNYARRMRRFNSLAWVSEGIDECQAMYIGYRHKRNGEYGYDHITHEFDYREEFGGFVVKEAVEVWMFVTHDNRNPMPVFPFGIDYEDNYDSANRGR